MKKQRLIKNAHLGYIMNQKEMALLKKKVKCNMQEKSTLK
jgi:hypothetical protein